MNLTEKERLLICINLAESYLCQNKPNKALEHFLMAEKLNLVLDADSYYLMSEIYKDLKEFQTSILYLNRTIIANPNKELLIKVYENLSSVLFQIKEYDLSLNYSNEVLKLDPNSQKAHTNIHYIANHYFILGIDCLEAKNYTEAITHFEKVNDLNGLAGRELGIAYYKNGELAKAISTYNSIINRLIKDNIAINARHYYELGIIYFKFGNFPEALINFKLTKKLKTKEDSININKVDEYISEINSTIEPFEEKTVCNFNV